MPLDLTIVILIGLLVGISVGFTGVGAGSLLTPILILALHVRPATAVGTALGFSAVTKAAGALQHLRQGTVNLRLVAHLAAGSLPAAIAALLVAPHLLGGGSQLSDTTIRRLIGIALALVAVVMTLRFVGRFPAPRLSLRPVVLVPVGVLLGVTVALTSVGSGSLAIGILAILTPLGMATLIGSDMAHAALLAAATAPFYLATGRVDGGLLAGLLVGAVPGVLFGSRLVTWLPERLLRATVLVAVWSIAIKLA